MAQKDSIDVGQKIIISILLEVIKKLDAANAASGNSDNFVDFFEAAMLYEYYWAIDWKFPEYNLGIETPNVVNETLDILEMWEMLETGYKNLSDKDRGKICGGKPEFAGFDGNNDEHYGIAKFLVNYLDRYEHFKSRKMNSHSPSIEGYRRMLNVYFKCRKEISNNFSDGLSAEQINEIMSAQAYK